MCIALLVVHAFLPPHPGPVAAAGLLNAEPGRILLWGLPVCVGAAVVAYLLTRWMTQRAAYVGPDTQDVLAAPAVLGEVEGRLAATNRAAPAPGLPLVIALILLPIVLIMLGSLSRTILPADSPAIGVLATLGIPFVALLIDVLLCAYLLGTRRGWSRGEVSDVLGAAIPGIAIVVLVTGAGGIFAKVLVGSGIGSAIAALLQSTGLPILALAFLITMLLRAAQGPTTVAIIATAGIIEPLVSQAHYGANQLALVCLAMGAGGLSVSHVNDPGFWIVTRLTGMSVSTGLRTWTVVTTCAGVAGFAILGGLWLLM
jgi:GntP family gluconate:H+ symporter